MHSYQLKVYYCQSDQVEGKTMHKVSGPKGAIRYVTPRECGGLNVIGNLGRRPALTADAILERLRKGPSTLKLLAVTLPYSPKSIKAITTRLARKHMVIRVSFDKSAWYAHEDNTTKKQLERIAKDHITKKRQQQMLNQLKKREKATTRDLLGKAIYLQRKKALIKLISEGLVKENKASRGSTWTITNKGLAKLKSLTKELNQLDGIKT